MMNSTDLVSSISQLLQLEAETRRQTTNVAASPEQELEWSMPRKVSIIPRKAAEWDSMPRKVNISPTVETSSPEVSSLHAAWKMSSIRSRASSNISGPSTCDTSDTRSNSGSDPESSVDVSRVQSDLSFMVNGGVAPQGYSAPGAHLSLASRIAAPPPGLSAIPAAAPAAAGQDKPKQVCTLKIKNLPRRCTQPEILRAVEEIGFGDGYDFFFLPVGPQSKQNRGYAFMNFRDPVTAANFRQAFAGYRIREKAVEVVAAPVQGLAENMMRYSKQNENGEWTYPRMLVLSA